MAGRSTFPPMEQGKHRQKPCRNIRMAAKWIARNSGGCRRNIERFWGGTCGKVYLREMPRQFEKFAMHWRNWIFVVGLLVLLPTGAQSQIVTDGVSLKQRCASIQLSLPTAGLGCRGYIAAVADILRDGNTIYNYRACPPPSVKREAMVKTVKVWLTSHPGDLRQRASVLVARALSESYPCAKK